MRSSHLDGHRRRPRIAFAVRPGHASAALLLWVPALSPRTHAWKITLFAARGLLMSAQHCLVFVLGFQSWRVDSQGCCISRFHSHRDSSFEFRKCLRQKWQPTAVQHLIFMLNSKWDISAHHQRNYMYIWNTTQLPSARMPAVLAFLTTLHPSPSKLKQQ